MAMSKNVPTRESAKILYEALKEMGTVQFEEVQRLLDKQPAIDYLYQCLLCEDSIPPCPGWDFFESIAYEVLSLNIYNNVCSDRLNLLIAFLKEIGQVDEKVKELADFIESGIIGCDEGPEDVAPDKITEKLKEMEKWIEEVRDGLAAEIREMQSRLEDVTDRLSTFEDTMEGFDNDIIDQKIKEILRTMIKKTMSAL